MRNLVIALSLTVALLAGCLIGATASRLIVPPVRAGTNPAKWEYKCFRDNDTADIEKKANQLGRAGFEMSGATRPYRYAAASTWCFKRRLP